jgi:sugar/nucleoside kinase (ribokinase family)
MGGKQIKIIAVGAAVQDVYLSHSDELKPVSDRSTHEQFMKLELGSKADVNNIVFSTGGGATNAATTFARQGHHALFMGVIGHDTAGRAVTDVLDHEGIDTSLLSYSHTYNTGYSVLLLAPNGERTVLTYRGASTHYRKTDFKIKGIHADWLYVTTLAGDFDILHSLFDEARRQNIKIMFNPGRGELAHPQKLKALLENVEILLLNKDEAKTLVEGTTMEELLLHLHHYVPVVLISDGPNGVMAGDKTTMIRAGLYQDIRVIDRTGAGDAFGSGFLSQWVNGASLKDSILFASANATSVVNHIGTKTGILSKGALLHHMPLSERSY